MKVIELTRGQVAIVDDEDFSELAQYRWYFMTVGYAARCLYPSKKVVYMHRQITGAQKGEQVDHINENKLDNRRANLRIATKAENMRNRGAPTNSTTGLKGVSVQANTKRFRCGIKLKDGTKLYLGYFKSAKDAAHAYDEAAKLHHGEFARLNFEHGAS